LMHGKNAFKLTSDGALLLKRCRDLFRLLTDIQSDIAVNQRELTGSIRFGISQSLAYSLLPGFLNIFKKEYPKILPNIKLGRTALVREWVEKGDVEFAITVDDGKLSHFTQAQILKGCFCTVQSLSLPKEMKDHYLLTEDRPEVRKLKQHFKRHKKYDLTVAMEVESWEVILRLAEAELGIGFLPDFILNCQKSQKPKLKWTELPAINYRVVSIHTKDQELSRISQLFHLKLLEYYEECIEGTLACRP
jgi:DNA-binding transcriptional LysR family regulator